MIASATMNILTKISKISFKYGADGAISTILTINPSFEYEGQQFTSIEISNVSKNLKSLAEGDTLEVVFGKGIDDVNIRLTEISNNPRIDFSHKLCPVCREPLIKNNHGKHCCLNRDCPAQFSASLILFLSSLGLALHYPIMKVLDSLLSRGALSTFAQIFYVSAEDITSVNITPLEAQTFIHYIHSIRGRVSISQLCTALRIPGVNQEWCNELEKHFAKKNYHPKQIMEFLNYDKQAECLINWDGWNKFFSSESNMLVLATTVEYLFI